MGTTSTTSPQQLAATSATFNQRWWKNAILRRAAWHGLRGGTPLHGGNPHGVPSGLRRQHLQLVPAQRHELLNHAHAWFDAWLWVKTNGIPFGWVGDFTTHFGTYFSGWIESDVHWEPIWILTHGHIWTVGFSPSELQPFRKVAGRAQRLGWTLVIEGRRRDGDCGGL